jgi:hypothetical protein
MSTTLQTLIGLSNGKKPEDFKKLPLMKRGAKGPLVGQLQSMLASQGAYRHRIDEDFGKHTDGAVRYFQSTHVDSKGEYLKVDGEVGLETWWALFNPSGDAQDQKVVPSGTNRGLSKTRQDVINTGLKEFRIPVFEVPDGSNWGPRVAEYLGLLGIGPNPWCAAYIQAVLYWSTGSFLNGKSAHVWTIWRQAQAKGQAFKRDKRNPVPGDLFVQLHANGTGHIGFVYRVSEDGLWVSTLEGNTGNRVRIGKRRVATIAGWIVPYGDADVVYNFKKGLADGVDTGNLGDR